MGTGQILLAISAITLYSITLNNINSAYVNSIKYAINQQQVFEAIEIGNSITEKLYSESSSYQELDNLYGKLNDASSATKREMFLTQTGDSIAVTYSIGTEKEMIEGQNGRLITIQVFKQKTKNEYHLVSEHVVAMLKGS